ncbi:MAG: 30S ribosomal protein S21 [Gemmatimonadota bacterium]|nr:30S ribosomal protein S21 [Gemmatimonadota bacterium]
MIEISIADGDRLDHALRTFKKMVLKSGIMGELRKRRHYVKPSAARQLKSAAARRRSVKASRRRP